MYKKFPIKAMGHYCLALFLLQIYIPENFSRGKKDDLQALLQEEFHIPSLLLEWREYSLSKETCDSLPRQKDALAQLCVGPQGDLSLLHWKKREFYRVFAVFWEKNL